MDLLAAQRTQKHDIPLDHLDYKFIENCDNVKEIENIIKILRFCNYTNSLQHYNL